jgi:hypothetical protein
LPFSVLWRVGATQSPVGATLAERFENARQRIVAVETTQSRLNDDLKQIIRSRVENADSRFREVALSMGELVTGLESLGFVASVLPIERKEDSKDNVAWFSRVIVDFKLEGQERGLQLWLQSRLMRETSDSLDWSLSLQPTEWLLEGELTQRITLAHNQSALKAIEARLANFVDRLPEIVQFLKAGSFD